MKGLLVKDLNLVWVSGRMFPILVLAVAAITVWTGGDAEFIVSYSTGIFTMFVLSTLSYDEYDNGLEFLFSLPVNRKLYATEKYVFGFLSGAFGLVIAEVMKSICLLARGKGFIGAEAFLGDLMTFAVLIIVMAAMIPLRIRFGSEKGWIYVLIIFGICFGINFSMTISDSVWNFFTGIANIAGQLPDVVVLAVFYLAAAVACLVSWVISIKVLEGKEM